MGALLFREFQEIFLCCTEMEMGSTDEDAAQQALMKWRPKKDEFALNASKKQGAKKGGEDDDEDKDEDDDDDKKDESVASGSHRSGGKKSSGSSDKSDEDDDDDDDDGALAEGEKRIVRRQLVQMEFEALLRPDLDAIGEMMDPADLLKDGKRRKRKRPRGAGGMEEKVAMDWIRKILEKMKDEHKDVELPDELAVALETDTKTLIEAIKSGGVGILELIEDEDGNQVIEKTLAQKIVDEMDDNESDHLKVKDLCDMLDCTEEELWEAVENTGGCLTKVEKKRGGAVVKKVVDLVDRDQLDDEDDEQETEAEKKALEFRREQVRGKVDQFLRVYSKGVNLTKICREGQQRLHRRVYVDTAKKSLVIQGATGPKLYPFTQMRDIDLETRTTKEGRTETLVIIALEKGGRITKELQLIFPDQHKGNAFVNNLSLFSMALTQS